MYFVRFAICAYAVMAVIAVVSCASSRDFDRTGFIMMTSILLLLSSPFTYFLHVIIQPLIRDPSIPDFQLAFMTCFLIRRETRLKIGKELRPFVSVLLVVLSGLVLILPPIVGIFMILFLYE